MDETPSTELVYDFLDGFDDPGNKNAWFDSIIGSGKRVLEMGCATGYVGEFLVRERGCTVVGVEIVEAAAKKAIDRRCYERVIVGDLQNPELLAQLSDDSFDFILFGDVLEHLANPEIVLADVTRLLAPDGHVLVCVPNIVHWSMRMRVLLGRFDYTTTGTLDRTHLRFYTPKTAQQLITDGNLQVVGTSGVVWLPSVFRKLPAKVRFALERTAAKVRPSLFWGQVLLDAQVDHGSSRTS